MQESAIKKVVIAGGGTAGWMAAAAISKLIGKNLDITLIESEMIGTIGVGEATIPTMTWFNQLLGIDEAEFMREVQGTYKLGISFENWKALDDRYIHAFGVTGTGLLGLRLPALLDAWQTAGHGNGFWRLLPGARISRGAQVFSPAAKWAELCLSHRCFPLCKVPSQAQRGARHSSPRGKISRVNLDPEDGYIKSLLLDNGKEIEGDFFIDCTGMRALLIEGALHTGYESWSQWLPCDSAVAIQTESVAEPIPYTRAIARDAGWQWRIPLQHRVGNGIVYCSNYMTKDEAESTLLANIEGKTLTNPLHINFRPGRRLKQWHKNCLAVGLSSGFLEPLESTSIHLIQQNIVRFLRLFPATGIRQSEVDEFNKQADFDVERIRDFIILHYKVTERDDTDFWRHCRSMDIPDTLKHKIDVFVETGHVVREGNELFDDSWQQVMIGQGLMPERYHSLVDVMSEKELRDFLHHIKSTVDRTVSGMPSHADYLQGLLASGQQPQHQVS